MRYLYGDSSAFPLNQNFIVTLAAATDCAVALLKVDEALAKSHAVANRANAAALKEVGDIDQLLQRLESALAQRDHLSNATAKVVEQVAAATKGQFEKAKDGIRSWRDGTIRKSQKGCGPASMMAPLNRFMVKHELPYTSWGLRWKAGKGDEPVQAQVYAIMQRGLTSTLSVAIPPKHLWAQPVRVRQLEEGATIKLVGKNWLGKEKLRDEPIEKFYVTRVTRTTERHMFVLTKKPKEPSEGLKVVLREGDMKRITITRVDEEENVVGEPAGVDGSDAQLIKRIWRGIEESIADLVHHRHQLLAATMNGTRVTELETPAPVATALIQAIAPLVRDMRRHSRTPGELQLKRDLGDGRREELFISEKEVVTKYLPLEPKNQALFDAMGLTKTPMPNAEPSRPQRAQVVMSRSSEPRQEPLPQARLATPAELLPPPMSASMHDSHDARPITQPPPAPASQPAPPSSWSRQPASSFPPPPPASIPVPSRPPGSRPPAHSGVANSAVANSAVPNSAAHPTIPPPAPLPSSLPAPSQPPKRRRAQITQPPQSAQPPSSMDHNHSRGEVFRLPPPTTPPPKRRPKMKSNRRAM
jgi:hypothetical protein